MSNLSDMEGDQNFENSKEFISLSRYTVYHSAEDLDYDLDADSLRQPEFVSVDEGSNLMEHKTDMVMAEMPRDDKVAPKTIGEILVG